MLVILGATTEGKKELVGFHVGGRESSQSWREPRRWSDAGRRNPTGQTICNNEGLSRLDAMLEQVYGRARASNEDAEQITWLRDQRDACGRDPLCIAFAYTDRIDELDAPLAQAATRRHDVDIPAGHFPPPGMCRIWHPDRPPGRQPPPSACDVSVPAGAVLIRG